MAARTSAGVGVGVTVTLLGIISLGLFITTIVFLSRYQATQGELRQAQQETEAFIKSSERSRDDFVRLKEPARSDRGKSVIAYLNDSLRGTMQRVTGNAADSLEQLGTKLERVEGATGNNLLAVVRERDAEVARLRQAFQEAEDARITAQNNQAAESARVAKLQESHQQTIAALNADIDRYKGEVDNYRESVNTARREMDERVARLQQKADAERDLLAKQVQELKNQNLVLNETISKMRGTGERNLLTGADEFALVDGKVVGVSQSAGEVFIGLGQKQNVVLGMTFTVYADARSIRPDASGEYPRGKATLEVINVGTESSSCRVLNEIRGNPVVKGDVIANAVYDPEKVYKFVVYGVFDANGDGRSTEAEAEDIKSVIAGWGGKIEDDLIGDIDFLVLGARPALPPPPPSGAPIEVVLEYQRLLDKANRYDDLLKQATVTSLPILNQNRLYTLVGRRLTGR